MIRYFAITLAFALATASGEYASTAREAFLGSIDIYAPTPYRLLQTTTTTTTSSSNGTLAYSGTAATFQNIPNLLVVINGIATVYNSLYAPMPTNSGSSDTLTSITNGLLMYATLRNFIIAFAQNYDKILADANYLIKNFGNVPFTKMEVLAFYGLSNQYTAMKMNLNSTSGTFQALDTTLTLQTNTFLTTQLTISRSLTSLYNITNNIYSQTGYLRTQMNSNAAISALQQVDQTLLILPTLIAYNTQIQADITNTKAGFNALTGLRATLVTTINNMNLALQGLYSPTPNTTTSADLWAVPTTLALAAVVCAF